MLLYVFVIYYVKTSFMINVVQLFNPLMQFTENFHKEKKTIQFKI